MKPFKYLVISVEGGVDFDVQGFRTSKAATKVWRKINRDQDHGCDSLFLMKLADVRDGDALAVEAGT